MRKIGLGHRSIEPILVLLLSSVIFVVAHYRGLTSPFVINDDVQQQIYWMQQWLDKDLYPDSRLLDYSRQYVPWGVQGIYWLASRFMDPMNVTKVLAGLLFVLAAVAFHGIGRVLRDRLTAWAMVACFWLMPFFLFRISGGLARGFAVPLLALLLFFWLSGRGWSMGLVLLCMALTIPYIFVLSLTAVVIGRIKDGIFNTAKWRTPFPQRAGHYFLGAAGIIILLWWRQDYMASGFGPLATWQDMIGNPEFGADGRYPMLPVPGLFWEFIIRSWQWIGPYREADSVWAGIMGSLVVVAFAFWGARGFEWKMLKDKWQPFFYVAVSSFIFYALARIFLLKLFVPSRYVMYTVSVLYCVLLGLCFRGLLGSQLKPLVAGLLLTGVVGLSMVRLYGVGLYDYSTNASLYSALKETPKTSLIAGHPYLLDQAQTFGRRNVFASFELAHPWSMGFWQKMRPRIKALFNAYYAEDPDTVKMFCRKNRIDFFVVDSRHFTRGFVENRPFFAPFDGMIQELFRNRRDFALLKEDLFSGTRIDQHIRLLNFRWDEKKGFLKGKKEGHP